MASDFDAMRLADLLEHEARAHGPTDYKHKAAAMLRSLATQPTASNAGEREDIAEEFAHSKYASTADRNMALLDEIERLRAALASKPLRDDTQRCIEARNKLNAAMYGEGALIDDLEYAVANACVKLASKPAAPPAREALTECGYEACDCRGYCKRSATTPAPAGQDKEAERLHKLLILQHAESVELWNALKDLSFECDGVTCVLPPSREVYNRTFKVLQSKPHLSPAALSGHGESVGAARGDEVNQK